MMTKIVILTNYLTKVIRKFDFQIRSVCVIISIKKVVKFRLKICGREEFFIYSYFP